MTNVEGCRKNRPWPALRQHPGGTEKDSKHNLSRYSRFHHKDSNRVSPKNKSKMYFGIIIPLSFRSNLFISRNTLQ